MSSASRPASAVVVWWESMDTSANWPLESFSTTTFTEHKGKTSLTLRWSPYRRTPPSARLSTAPTTA